MGEHAKKRKLSDEVRLHRKVVVRLTPAEEHKLRAKAKALDLTPSQVLRELVRRLQP